jgi:uncharacterized protein DUF4352
MSSKRLRNSWYILSILLFGLVGVGCSKPTASPLAAAGPFTYPSTATPPLERVAVLVTVTNQGTDDMQINPADFLARDADHHIYTANSTAAGADGNLVRLITGPRLEALPLPTVTLRQSEILSGFIVFDVPQGVRPVELIWRQSDADQVAQLERPS